MARKVQISFMYIDDDNGEEDLPVDQSLRLLADAVKQDLDARIGVTLIPEEALESLNALDIVVEISTCG